MFKPIESVHTKGITLNSQNAEKIHYESMKQLIQNRDDVVTAVGTALKRERVKGTDEMTIRSLRPERSFAATCCALSFGPTNASIPHASFKARA